MRALVQRLSEQNIYSRLLGWGKLITVTGTAQVLIQGIGFISGILIIRLLPTEEYAFYTLANTMLGTMLIIADGGITSGVLSEGGKVWQDSAKFSSVIVTGFRLLRKFAFFGLAITILALYYLLSSHGASLKLTAIITCSLVPAFFTCLTGTLMEIAPKIKQDVLPLQKIQVITAFGRLILICTFLFALPFTWIALLAFGIPQLYGNYLLKKISRNLVDYNQKPDIKVEKAILKIVKRVLPGSIYYCFSSQLTLWLISLSGSTNEIAQMGALGRVSMILTLFTVMFGMLILPRFARLPAVFSVLIRWFLQIEIGLLLLMSLIVGFFWFFSAQVLWILGDYYENLNTEVVLNISGSCLSIIAGITFTLCASRGWAIHPIISIGVSILSIILGVFFFNISTLTGILFLNIFIAAVQVLMNLIYSCIKIYQLKRPVINLVNKAIKFL